MKRLIAAVVPVAALAFGAGCERKTTVVEPSGPVYGDDGGRHYEGGGARRSDDDDRGRWHDDRDDHDRR